MQAHLIEISAAVDLGARPVVIVNLTGWQTPPYSGEGSTKVGSGSNYDLRHRLELRLEYGGEPTLSLERRQCSGERT